MKSLIPQPSTFSNLWQWILNRFPLWHVIAGGVVLFCG